MRQLTLASEESFEKYRKQTRREKFLGGDGPDHAVAGVGVVDRAALPEGW
jgi:hypothetical protein